MAAKGVQRDQGDPGYGSRYLEHVCGSDRAEQERLEIRQIKWREMTKRTSRRFSGKLKSSNEPGTERPELIHKREVAANRSTKMLSM